MKCRFFLLCLGATGATGVSAQMIFFNSGGTLTSNNLQLYGAQRTLATETQSQILSSRSATLRNLRVFLTAAPGGATSRTFTVRVNGAGTTLLATVAGAATTATDLVNTVAVVAGDRISLLHTVVGAPAAAVGQAVFEYQ